ncbi:hypothetical protein I3760_15G027300 [Carya illinoinensis]|nr:hypothetical protein I3760_15G027300 [Carya illinoinensis]
MGRSMAEAKMVKKLSPDGGKVVCTRAKVPELKVVKLSPSEQETRRLYTQLLMEMKKLSPGTSQAEVCNKVEPDWKLVWNFSASEERPSMFSREKPWFKPKVGGLIPAKRRLVKRMMFDYIANSITRVFCAGRRSSHD